MIEFFVTLTFFQTFAFSSFPWYLSRRSGSAFLLNHSTFHGLWYPGWLVHWLYAPCDVMQPTLLWVSGRSHSRGRHSKALPSDIVPSPARHGAIPSPATLLELIRYITDPKTTSNECVAILGKHHPSIHLSIFISVTSSWVCLAQAALIRALNHNLHFSFTDSED